jgi:predicted phage terminase large subunit-like protein
MPTTYRLPYASVRPRLLKKFKDYGKPPSEPAQSKTESKVTPDTPELPGLDSGGSEGGQKGKEVTFDPVGLESSIYRDSFYEFMVHFWPTVVAEKPIWNWHIKYLCEELQEMAERVFRGERKEYDLVVNVAPGTTKSMVMSVMFCPWAWTRMPSFRFIGASYSFPLAMDLSIKSRDVVRSDEYARLFPEIEIREDQNTKGYFKTKEGGFRYAVGVNGSITGMHAHFIVIDDPLNPQEALSNADIATANHWIKHTLSNRKVDKAVAPMALVMQRLHQDDPTASFLEAGKKSGRVRHVCLPAEIEPDLEDSNVKPKELEGYYVDGLMDPVRLNHEVLSEEKAKGQYYFSSQFRQDPVPATGGMFHIAKVKWAAPPRQDGWLNLVRFWDKAATQDGGTWTVGTKMGLDRQGRYWVLDVLRFQLDSGARNVQMEEAAYRDGWETVVGVEQEPGSGGKESAEYTVKSLSAFRVKVLKVDATTGGKVARADPLAGQMNIGNVYIPVEFRDENGWIGWVKEWMEELRYFPHSRHMDQVDSASGAFSLLQRKKVRIGGLVPSKGYQPFIDLSEKRMDSLKRGPYKSRKERMAIMTGKK